MGWGGGWGLSSALSTGPVFPLLLLGAVRFQVHREPLQAGYRESFHSSPAEAGSTQWDTDGQILPGPTSEPRVRGSEMGGHIYHQRTGEKEITGFSEALLKCPDSQVESLGCKKPPARNSLPLCLGSLSSIAWNSLGRVWVGEHSLSCLPFSLLNAFALTR